MPKEEIVNLALRRGLFYPAAEIYSSSPAGFWDFGPIGETIRRKVIDFWRNELVEREGFVEIFGCQILPEDVFKASGHLESFNDPIVQCKDCHAFFRADKLIEEATGEELPESMPTEKYDALIKEKNLECKKCGAKNFENVKLFNMMMKVNIGAEGSNPCYLRPETCQSIFLDFLRIYRSGRQELPLGVAQAGASFRNEIAPRNTLLRERELGQMEIEIFFNPKKIDDIKNFDEVKDYKLRLKLLNKDVSDVSCQEAVDKKIVSGKLVAYYLARVQQLYEKYGIPLEKMRFRELEDEARAFYAKETWDFEVETDLGWIELIACNYRTDYDLKRHSEISKKDLKVKEDGEAFFPHVFEISTGIDRTFYVVLDLAFRREKRGPEERVFLDLNPKIAPYMIGILPLVKKDGLGDKARELFAELGDYNFDVFFDEKGSIGKRYARLDEVGVPYCITVDYETFEEGTKGTVTLRDRNSMDQKRVKISDLPVILLKLIAGKLTFKDI